MAAAGTFFMPCKDIASLQMLERGQAHTCKKRVVTSPSFISCACKARLKLAKPSSQPHDAKGAAA